MDLFYSRRSKVGEECLVERDGGDSVETLVKRKDSLLRMSL